MMKFKTPHRNGTQYDDKVKPLRSTLKEFDKAHLKNKQAVLFSNENGFNGDQRSVQIQSRLQKVDSFRQESKFQFRNAQKLKHFEQIKASNVDDLNQKIQKMISKLSEQVSPYSSFASTNYDNKIRFKTDYSEISSNVSNSNPPSGLDSYERKKMAQSFIVSNQLLQDKREYSAKNANIDQIRRKYKEGSKAHSKNSHHHQKTLSALSNNSKMDESNLQNFNAQLIRFRQKLKQNNEKDRRQLCRQLKYTSAQMEKQKLSKTSKKSCNKNIEEQLINYQKRLNAYNSKKLISLTNEGSIERVPLGDKTNSNNCYLKYSPYKRKQQFQPSVKQEKPFEPDIEDNQQNDEPLTADFRQLTQKNQLKLLLKNLTHQICLDEEFRNCKKWFSKLSYSNKWNQLAIRIEQSKLNLDPGSIYQIFSIRQQQQNPFYTPRENQFNLRQMVDIFIKCQQNWFQNIVKKYSRQRLFQSGFRKSKIDIGNKGHLSIQDLVRFINIQIDVQIRNRDILIIFERLRSEEYLSFDDLVEVISY